MGALLAGTRLLTVIGMGGAGKTRLALEVAVAAAAGTAFSDGVVLVELASVAAPAGVPAAFVGALGLEVGAMLDATATVDRVGEHLAGQQLLLVVDNCEHVILACAELIAALLLRCPGLTVLATSREVLGLGVEVVWPIPPLSLPGPDAASPADLEGSDAAALFCGRVAAAAPGFVLDASTVPAVAQICRRLDGIPLALELAAARARVLGVGEIAARLDDRFDLLGGGSRLALPHHQTLRAAMDWSHDLLAEDEQVALRRLAVFPATFDLGAAGAVIDAAGSEGARRPSTGAVDVLARLVDKSLVTPASTGLDTRYRLLETVREYAAERLAAAGETEDAGGRHRAWFVDLAREWQARSGDPWWSRNAWPSRLSADESSFRAAVRHALEAGDDEAALDLVAALWMFWLMSFSTEGIDLLERAVAATGDVATPSRVRALYGLAYLRSYDEQVDMPRVLGLLDEAVALGEALHGEHSDWMAHHGRADLALRNGDLTRAQADAEAALARAEALDVPVGIAYCERLLGWVATAQGDLDAARRRFERSLDKGWHCDLATAHAAAALAPLVAKAGDAVRVRYLVAESLNRSRRSPLRLVEAMALVQACKVAVVAGRPNEAAGHAADLMALLSRTGARAWVADAFDAAVLVLATTNRPAAAARLAGACDGLREARHEYGMPDLAAERAAARAGCADVLGDAGWAAEVAAGRALSLAEALAFARSELGARAPAPEPARAPATSTTAVLRQVGTSWEVAFRGHQAFLRDAKGLHDLAVLVSRPLQDVHVLELASPDPRLAAAAAPGAPVLDAAALASYRSRLAELDEQEAAAVHRDDPARLGRLDGERAALRAELRTATGLGGRRRVLGADATERARKAVSARLREATRRIGEVLPELGAHLDRSLVTGTSCRYAPQEAVTWVLGAT